MAKSTYGVRQEGCLHGEEVDGQDAGGLGARELAGSRAPAGEAPARGRWLFSSVRIVVADILTPNLVSSPLILRQPQRDSPCPSTG